jgi:predicted TIM-barrel fold metal-dependent hydrolase
LIDNKNIAEDAKEAILHGNAEEFYRLAHDRT